MNRFDSSSGAYGFGFRWLSPQFSNTVLFRMRWVRMHKRRNVTRLPVLYFRQRFDERRLDDA
ncbi:hypothetical protein PROFUN_14609 [Planoprotostelium fungivorum]|uniref:Uncharacterized protein n=1 Tax=Planoprotostelium fungivorum TaxID=1890364 RepID=A0A2P6MZF0_9EUKA|nr:hypothetical protein PROFUN_14609 [Planoprotostelium fungivorum]